MLETKAIKKGFLGVMLAFFLSSLSVVLVPFSTSKSEELNTVGYVSGALFWIGLLAGCAVYFYLYYRNRVMIQEVIEHPKRPTVINFFSNRPGIITDIVMIISLAVSIYCAVKITVNSVIVLIFLFLLLISIYGHFLFNGKIYRYICNKQKKITEGKDM